MSVCRLAAPRIFSFRTAQAVLAASFSRRTVSRSSSSTLFRIAFAFSRGEAVALAPLHGLPHGLAAPTFQLGNLLPKACELITIPTTVFTLDFGHQLFPLPLRLGQREPATAPFHVRPPLGSFLAEERDLLRPMLAQRLDFRFGGESLTAQARVDDLALDAEEPVPRRSAATPVVPEPRKGSKMRPPGSQISTS